jgi:uncharacterized glyoxalase superfamily protein PhnB
VTEKSGQIAYPIVSYQDARAGIEWLRRAFGAEEVAVHEDGGRIAHFELSFEGGVVMGGSKGIGELAKTGKADVGTTAVYLVISDPDAHHKRAVAAGAEIVIPLRDEDYGSRGYTALDPEGNIWSFGTYAP